MIWALHGAVGRAADWHPFASAMRAQGEEVRRLDLWRFLDCCPMPLEKFGDTLAGEITRIDPSPTLVGYSMGGRLALHALLAKPDFWKSAVIISAHPGLSDESERAARRISDAEWSARALKGEWPEFLEQWSAQGVLEGVEMPERLSLKDRRASIARSFIDWSLGAQKDLTPRLQEIRTPVLWLSGERDRKFSELAAEAVPHLPQGHHEVVADCGHRVPWEKPTQFADLVRAFLETT
ncbi:alpha/beta fold hydrolase [Verrucomicrobiaceae bacterium 5K15]|uniref:Alpha/beta fold hydrolase n=1 Tax=Oceaniferula flava TaxID=2800421 RepID=A0AAE2VB91_9BACT|nr:alpha/beta fold hydrolase [Oceaniferula flavus]MBK1854280.1 alpha/beta fold hydrolase [Oceaniferula flavus]MBM1135586.1 alpha/beta fold hydrolase [Oceaniferula flavus]